MTKYLLLCIVAVLGGCADLLQATQLTPEPAKVAASTVVVTPAVVEAKVQRVAPDVCLPEAIQAAVTVAKSGGGQTPPEAVDAAYVATASRLGKGQAAHRACFCWMVSEGLVNVDTVAAAKRCKGVKIPAAKPIKEAKQ